MSLCHRVIQCYYQNASNERFIVFRDLKFTLLITFDIKERLSIDFLHHSTSLEFYLFISTITFLKVKCLLLQLIHDNLIFPVSGVASGLLSLVTITGNFMVMISFKMDKQLQTISNYFLFSLAVADLIIGLISMPLQTVFIIHKVS